MPGRERGRQTGGPPETPALLAVLTVLTATSGLVDAVSYLGLGRVFTANMTGNVVVLGFAAAGAAGFSVTGALTSLGTFLIGAAAAGVVFRHVGSTRRCLLASMVAESMLAGGAALVVAGTSVAGPGWARHLVIGLLGLAMGQRNSTVRRLAVPEVRTNVLTTTLTGLASDALDPGAGRTHQGRRTAAVVFMFGGAAVGAVIVLRAGLGWALLLETVVVLVSAVAFGISPASRRLDTPAAA